jgi:hypothetical protein
VRLAKTKRERVVLTKCMLKIGTDLWLAKGKTATGQAAGKGILIIST